jgi:hypothetical protein
MGLGGDAGAFVYQDAVKRVVISGANVDGGTDFSWP